MQFNYFDLFIESSLVVQIIILILIFCSIISWSIIFEKLFSVSKQAKNLKKFEKFYINNRANDEITLKALSNQDDLYSPLIPYKSFKKIREFLIDNEQIYTIQELKNLIDQNFQYYMREIENRIDILGTIGSTSIYISLLGTIFGIIRSFQAISESKTVNLAIIGPGLSEALLTTALGLIVALPAVIFYNKFTKELDYIYAFSEGFFGDIARMISNRLYSKK